MKRKDNKKRKGFTLIELIVVIAILAILAAVAVPQFFSLIERAEEATIEAAAAQYVSAINVYNALARTDGEGGLIEEKGDDLDELSRWLGDLSPTGVSENVKEDVFAKINVSSDGIATLG